MVNVLLILTLCEGVRQGWLSLPQRADQSNHLEGANSGVRRDFVEKDMLVLSMSGWSPRNLLKKSDNILVEGHENVD